MQAVAKSDSVLLSVSDRIDDVIRKIGHVISWVYVLLVLAIVTQVVLRKGFSSGLIIIEELQWHLYAIGVLFGLSYAQINNSHVRVDIFYSGYREKTKYIVAIAGIVFLVFPFIAVIFIHSLDFVANSFRVNESSSSPSGLPWRWLIKSMIPISFALLGLAVLSRLIRVSTLLYKGAP